MDFHSSMLKSSYRKIFVVESLATWQFSDEYDPKIDLVLTLDYGLRKSIESLEGEVYYLDALSTIPILQENNTIFLEFLQGWFFNKDKQDMFNHCDINFGKSLRILFWSELMYFVRLCISLEEIIKIKYDTLILSENTNYLKMSLSAMEITFDQRAMEEENTGESYFFDIHRYMREALNNHSIKHRTIQIYLFTYSRIRLKLDELFHSNRARVCLQVYHPTLKIIQQLRRIPGVQVITSGYVPTNTIFSLLKQRLIISPRNNNTKYFLEAKSILKRLDENRINMMVLSSGRDISDDCYALINYYIQNKLPKVLGEIDASLRFQRNLDIDLNLCISTIGVANTVFNEVCRVNGARTFFIANGLLNSQFGDEGSDFDFINCYSVEMQKNYFSNSTRAIPLGDPRMDAYGNQTPTRVIDRACPTVVIGTSGFNSTDFTSYVAIEFEFMSDILEAIIKIPSYNSQIKIVIKVRSNGYLPQYESFVQQYFPFLNISLIQDISIIDLLGECDLYISIASQTLFEASCLGIPVIYYKNDREILDSPFNSRSELPTFHTSDELVVALEEFRLNKDDFAIFQDRKVMEKYIGSLDGLNLTRNLDFIMKLISTETV